MKTEKPLTKKLSGKQRAPKSTDRPGKQFRHRDRGTHVGRTKGS